MDYTTAPPSVHFYGRAGLSCREASLWVMAVSSRMHQRMLWACPRVLWAGAQASTQLSCGPPSATSWLDHERGLTTTHLYLLSQLWMGKKVVAQGLMATCESLSWFYLSSHCTRHSTRPNAQYIGCAQWRFLFNASVNVPLVEIEGPNNLDVWRKHPSAEQSGGWMKEICVIDIFEVFHLLWWFTELVRKRTESCMARNGEIWWVRHSEKYGRWAAPRRPLPISGIQRWT